MGWGRPGEGWAGERVQQRERSGLGVGVGSLDVRREATGTPRVCYNPAVAPRSSHDVGRYVGQAPRSATELLQDTSQPLCTSTSPVSREHHCGPKAGRPEAHPGSNPLGRLSWWSWIPPPSLSLGLLICTILGGSCHFLHTLEDPGSGLAFTPLWRECHISASWGRSPNLLKVGR